MARKVITSDDIQKHAKNIAAECHQERKPKFTMRSLAEKAQVSVRMLVRIENAQQLEVVLRNAHQRTRQRSEIARVLAQVSIALGLDSRRWLSHPALALTQAEIQGAVERAEARLKSSQSFDESRPLNAVQRGHEVRLSCGQVPYGPFGIALSKNGPSFLSALTSMAIGAISPDIEIDFDIISDFRSALSTSRHDIVIGYLAQLQREFGLGRWHFATIPGFRIRTSFLTKNTTSHKIDNWRSVLSGCTQCPVKLQIVTIAGSVADSLMQNVWQQPVPASDRLPLRSINSAYNQQQIWEELLSIFKNDNSTPAVFVADEVTADSVYHQGLNTELVDLAEGDEDASPAYPLGIAARSSDDIPLADAFRRSMKEELFEANAGVLAHFYAGYLMCAFTHHPYLGAKFRKIASGQDLGNLPRLPSYMRVIPRSGAWELSGTFLSELRKALAGHLSQHYADSSPIHIMELVELFIAPLSSQYSAVSEVDS